MRIKYRIFINFFLIALGSLAVVIGVLFYFGKQTSTSTISGYNYLLAQNDIESVDRFIDRRLERWESYVHSNTDLFQALDKSNSEFAELGERDKFIAEQDENWKKSEGVTLTPFMQGIVGNSLSAGLRMRTAFYEKRAGYKIFPEFFITNKYGVLIASTGKTSDYLQSDEGWWQQAVKEGVWVEDISLDASTGINSLAFCIRIDDEKGNFAGMAKVIYDIKDVGGIIDTVVKSSGSGIGNIGFERKTVVASLFNKEGKIIYSTKNGFGDLKEVPEYSSVMRQMMEGDHRLYLTANINGVEKLYTHAESDGSGDFKGLGWMIIVEKETQEVMAPLSRLGRYALLAVLLALLGVIIAASWLSYSFNRPLRQLMEAVKRVENGDLSVKISRLSRDEIGDLAVAFNNSVEAVKKSRAEVDKKVADQTKEIREKATALAEQQKATLNVLEDVEIEKEKATRERDKTDIILHSIGDGVLVVDKNYKIIIFNGEAEKISGFSATEAIGKRYDAILKFIFEKDEKVNDEFIKGALETGQIKQMANHTVLIKKDGSRVPVADSAAPFKDKGGQVVGCVVVFRDVTHEREIDQMKSEFVSVASHQLRTPLTGIKWFAELLMKTKINKDAKDYVKQISISNERMVRLVDDLLNVSRIETGRKFDIVLKDTDLVPLVKGVIDEQKSSADERHVTISCATDAPKELIMHVDELKMRQAVQNLISNAIKYSKENGNIVVGCEHKPDEIVFSVKDNGIGIPKKQQGQIFNKFFRAENVFTVHTDGTGLGLYIVKAIVEAHGGKVWFESEENVGTTFYFSLPTKTKK